MVNIETTIAAAIMSARTPKNLQSRLDRIYLADCEGFLTWARADKATQAMAFAFLIFNLLPARTARLSAREKSFAFAGTPPALVAYETTAGLGLSLVDIQTSLRSMASPDAPPPSIWRVPRRAICDHYLAGARPESPASGRAQVG